MKSQLINIIVSTIIPIYHFASGGYLEHSELGVCDAWFLSVSNSQQKSHMFLCMLRRWCLLFFEPSSLCVFLSSLTLKGAFLSKEKCDFHLFEY